MMEIKPTGSMTLTSRTAVALWKAEIAGQLSDGMWENAAPHDHWRFWCRLVVSVGPDNAVAPAQHAYCRKNGYALERLPRLKYEGTGGYVLRDRMLAYGRMARAGADVGDTELLRAAEYMPATLDDFLERKSRRDWGADYVADYMDKVELPLAVSFYATEYTTRDLNSDIRLIKAAMRTAPKCW